MDLFGPQKKWFGMAPNGAGRTFSPLIQTLPTLVDGFGFKEFPGPQISKFPDFQTPPAPDEFSDPNLTPLPTHPRIKYVARALAVMFILSEWIRLVPGHIVGSFPDIQCHKHCVISLT